MELGTVEALFRYPVKSMAGEQLDVADIGWHGIPGDRRLALRKVNDATGFPWLTASKVRELLLYTPCHMEDGADGAIPTHVRTPSGVELPAFGSELASEIAERLGAPVEMMHLKHGTFDEAPISVISADTVQEIGRRAELPADIRRFRPNIVLRMRRPVPFEEDGWVGGVISFGDGADSPSVTVTMRDPRCSMINLDPDTAASSPEMMKAVVAANGNTAGIYGTVTRGGRIAVGQAAYLTR